MGSRVPLLLLSLFLSAYLAGCADSEGSDSKEPEEVQCRDDQAQCGSLCVVLDSNPFHCGECNQACGEGESCEAGSCVTGCSEGRTSCDGACVDLRTDLHNCGQCGVACNEGQLCREGSCRDKGEEEEEECEGEEVACEGGCTDLSRDPANCGACGNACGAEESCEAGQCVGTGGGCSAGETLCGEVCVDTTTDIEHCGQCDFACVGGANATAAFCEESACGLTCEDGFGNCDGELETGCETRLVDNDEHCGACGNDCGAAPKVAEAFCWETTCQITECEEGWGNCDFSPENGCETDTDNDVKNCGGCGIDCSDLPNNVAAPACNDGVCALQCADGYGDCDGDPSNGCEFALDSRDNCGACGNVCDEHEQCIEGGCVDFQRAEWPVPADSPVFTVKDGIASDETTGLMWRLGDRGSFEKLEEAIAFCEGVELGGYDDWRVPSIMELQMITDHASMYPSLDLEVFTFHEGEFDFTIYLTNTVSLQSVGSSNMWGQNFMLGFNAQVNWPASVVCVRGGKILPGMPRYIYEDEGETVYATRTNLTWQRYTSGVKMNWEDAKAHCEASTLGGVSDWRLPTVKELITLADYRRETPAIDPSVFPMTYPDDYWSSTEANEGQYRAVYFGSGGVGFPTAGSAEKYVRCVRAGALPPAED